MSKSDSGTQPTGRFRRQMRSLREDEILQAASRDLLRRGCIEFRVEDVAAACGVAKGTCYQHFASRPALIRAAIHRVDEALAAHLSSPPAHLGQPHQLLEWTLFEVCDAQIRTLMRRTKRDDVGIDANELIWPCCLGRMPCPHGGAPRSTDILRRCAKRMAQDRSGRARRALLVVTMALAVVPFIFFELERTRPPSIRAVRTSVRRILKLFFG